MNEEEKMDLLKRSILKAQSYTPLFTKSVIGCQSIRWQRTRTSSSTAIMHTCTTYRHDGSENMPDGLSANYLDRMNKGVFADDLSEWTSTGLSGMKRSEFTDIKETAEKFGEIIDETRHNE